MAADNIGVICGAVTGMVYAVINPDDDSELDNPRLLLLQAGAEPMTLVRVPRGKYMGALSMDDIAAIVARLRT